MHKHSILNILAIVASLGMIAWLISSFFGGMFIYFLSFPWIILLICTLYFISILEMLITSKRNSVRNNRLKVSFHALVIFTMIIVAVFQLELFKAKRVLTATLKDDLYRYTLILRENGNCENEVSGMWGFHQVFQGKYKLHGDTVIFTQKPYDNDFFADVMLIDKESNAIFIERDSAGIFEKEKEYRTYFEIQ